MGNVFLGWVFQCLASHASIHVTVRSVNLDVRFLVFLLCLKGMWNLLHKWFSPDIWKCNTNNYGLIRIIIIIIIIIIIYYNIIIIIIYIFFFCCGAATQCVSWPPHSWGFLDHTGRRTTDGRTPLDEWSARRRDLYLTTHHTHDNTSMRPVGFEPTISAGERPQTYALDRAATGTGHNIL